MDNNILFRADSNTGIGAGDLMSLIYLSETFKNNGWNIFFLTRKYPAGLRIIEKFKIDNVAFIDAEADIEEEVSVINKVILALNISWLVLEITERPLNEYRYISKNVNKIAITFDGPVMHGFKCIVDYCDINSERFRDKSEYADTVFMTGPEFVVLRDDIIKCQTKCREYRQFYKKILLIMGGVDEFNYICRIAGYLIGMNIDRELTIITGPGYKYRRELDNIVACSSNTNCIVKDNIDNMVEEYLQTDIAISAGGLAASELASTKTHSMLLAPFAHQVKRCQYFHSKRWAEYLGHELTDDLLKRIYDRILNRGFDYDFSGVEILNGNQKIYEIVIKNQIVG